MDKKKNISEILKRLKKAYPDQKTALKYTNPFELLVATILSAQATDMHVNRVTAKLFKKYRTVRDYATTPIEEFQNDISSINFYKTKGKNIIGAAILVMEKFDSLVPKSMAELVTLPGVARKTANIILSNAYGINEGIAVDTHVKRLSARLGLTRFQDPVKIEQDLMAITLRKEWSNLSHLLIFHGRVVCNAKKPRHSECVLYDLCPSNDL